MERLALSALIVSSFALCSVLGHVLPFSSSIEPHTNRNNNNNNHHHVIETRTPDERTMEKLIVDHESYTDEDNQQPLYLWKKSINSQNNNNEDSAGILKSSAAVEALSKDAAVAEWFERTRVKIPTDNHKDEFLTSLADGNQPSTPVYQNGDEDDKQTGSTEQNSKDKSSDDVWSNKNSKPKRRNQNEKEQQGTTYAYKYQQSSNFPNKSIKSRLYDNTDAENSLGSNRVLKSSIVTVDPRNEFVPTYKRADEFSLSRLAPQTNQSNDDDEKLVDDDTKNKKDKSSAGGTTTEDPEPRKNLTEIEKKANDGIDFVPIL